MKKILIIPIILIAFVCYVSYFMLTGEEGYIRSLANEQKDYISQHQKEFQYVFTELFTIVENCNQRSLIECEKQVQTLVDSSLNETLGYVLRDSERIEGRRPLYFIKLNNDNQIEKLFQSGRYNVETVDTKEEKMVVEMLEGKRDPYEAPLYTCYAPAKFRCEVPFVKQILPPRVYLKDFPTQIELIHLVKDNEEKTLGAVVWLYGD